MLGKIVGALLGKIILFLLLLAFIVALPFWPHSRKWGYIPAGVLAILFALAYVFARLGRL